MEYPLNITKFSNVSNIIIGVDGSFGGSKSALKFIGLKGDKLRNKDKVGEIIYEVIAKKSDH